MTQPSGASGEARRDFYVHLKTKWCRNALLKLASDLWCPLYGGKTEAKLCREATGVADKRATERPQCYCTTPQVIPRHL